MHMSLLIQTRHFFTGKSKQFYGQRTLILDEKQLFEPKNILMMDLFLPNKHLFTSQDVN